MRVGFDITRLLLKHNFGVPIVVEAMTREFLARPQELSLVLTADATAAEARENLHRRGLNLGTMEPWLLSTRQNYTRRIKQKIDKHLDKILPVAKPVVGHLVQAFDPVINYQFNRVLKRIDPINVFHHPDYVSAAWTGLNCPHVITIHDMIPVVFREHCTDYWLGFAEEAYIFGRTRAAGIITYSESSRHDIIDHLKVPADRVHAIPLAVRPALFQEIAPERIYDVLRKYSLVEHSYFLAVGRMDVLKNLERLVEAFATLADEPGMQHLKLVLTGPTSKATKADGVATVRDLIEKRGLADRTILTGYVDDDELSALMKGCACFVYPTLYEGFGLPVLEAMALGAPVIASNVSSVPEVAGEAAILVDPYSSDAIGEAMRSVVSNPALSRSLIEKGRIQAQSFSWSKTASAYLKVYQSVSA